MDTILCGIPHVLCYIDDILITGHSEEEHLCNLEEGLKRLQHHGVQLKADKCAFLQEFVEFKRAAYYSREGSSSQAGSNTEKSA